MEDQTSQHCPAVSALPILDRYQVRAEVAFRGHSNEFLCFDLRSNTWVSLEFFPLCASLGKHIIEAYAEHSRAVLDFHDLTRFGKISSGVRFVRQIQGSFEIDGPGRQLVIVSEPVGMSLHAYRNTWHERRLPIQACQSVVRDLLSCLDYLHHDAGIVHANLNETNLHFRISNPHVLSHTNLDDLYRPSARMTAADSLINVINESTEAPCPIESIVLCNFSDARWGAREYFDDVDPNVSRAPELLLGAPWNEKVDIWNLGILIWNLFEGRQLFSAYHDGVTRTKEHELAEIVAICHEPPIEFLEQYPAAEKYFDEDGNWAGSVPIPDLSLGADECRFFELERALFLDFMRQMLCWLPEDRMTAAELQKHPWTQLILQTFPDSCPCKL